LEQVYKERLAQQEAEGDDDDMDWDPIEDVLEDSRGSFVGMSALISLVSTLLLALKMGTTLRGANSVRQI
jgi:hypothetical protein